MAFDFPTSPTVGDTYTSGGVTYRWDGVAWVGGPIVDAGAYVLKAGDTMSGPLVLPADPTAALQAATKQYVDVVPSINGNRAGSGSVGLGVATWAKINIGNLTINNGGWSISGGSLVVPKTGTYLVGGSIQLQTPSSTGAAIVGISINNAAPTTLGRIWNPVANNVNWNINCQRIMLLTAGNTLELNGYFSVAGASVSDTADGTYLWATLLAQ